MLDCWSKDHPSTVHTPLHCMLFWSTVQFSTPQLHIYVITFYRWVQVHWSTVQPLKLSFLYKSSSEPFDLNHLQLGLVTNHHSMLVHWSSFHILLHLYHHWHRVDWISPLSPGEPLACWSTVSILLISPHWLGVDAVPPDGELMCPPTQIGDQSGPVVQYS